MISRCLPGIFPSPKVLSSQVGVHTPRALEDKAATLHEHQVFKRSLLQPQRPPLTPILLRKSETLQALALGVSIAQTITHPGPGILQPLDCATQPYSSPQTEGAEPPQSPRCPVPASVLHQKQENLSLLRTKSQTQRPPRTCPLLWW